LAIPNRWESVLNALLSSHAAQHEPRNGSLARRSPRFDLDVPEGAQMGLGKVLWRCKDENGDNRQGESQVHSERWDSHVEVTPNGFANVPDPPCPMAPARSEITYITLLNPLQGTHEREYPISRRIPSGDVERFHIMIGATMSCRLRVRFRFFIDRTSIVESEEFDLQLWNPQNSGMAHRYKDGSELQRDLGALHSWEESEIAELRCQGSMFPFQTPHRLPHDFTLSAAAEEEMNERLNRLLKGK
jgi:hypothetical protein